ncbi:beta-aspartyl-peptidase [Halioglobus sp. HI00S01]|uniref:isoaspartyl peptidase/L-asparaginase family protein n=1 Tax=Halioglobus sp. HI00S01 TaxID=1822214 RepID=UPI0007C2BECA|nr:isoaspartyl peptidase/L-asparaginase [Halioglobus sp. HI00S01]KZX60509.1 beta-aspartyl-peptidase [Halioglobus sp. HI00S01]
MLKVQILKPAIAALSLAVAASGMAASSETSAPLAIVIHGGAGTILKENMTEVTEKAVRAKLTEATNAGYAVLESNGSAMDAVIAAIRILEDSPLFNAGRGAVYNYEGHHELDASLMDGADQNAGAVAGVQHIRNPISLARLVMDASPHVMLMGEGAEAFARSQNVPMVENSIFNTERRYESLQKAKQKLEKEERRGKDYQAALDALPLHYRYGTVGAVALDASGNLAAGTSTGGMTAKRYGRIGDAPIIGAGTWADNASCAVSATGHGEYFIRFHVAADICARVKYQGKSAQQAADNVIHDVLMPAGGTGGVIVLDPAGNISMSFNTPGMYRASRSREQPVKTGIYKAD